MQRESDRDFHTRRAREELDRAYRADGWTAMSAHFRLSSLHMQKVRERSGPAILARIARANIAVTQRGAGMAGQVTAATPRRPEALATA
jgi:hypothetical protein